MHAISGHSVRASYTSRQGNSSDDDAERYYEAAGSSRGSVVGDASYVATTSQRQIHELASSLISAHGLLASGPGSQPAPGAISPACQQPQQPSASRRVQLPQNVCAQQTPADTGMIHGEAAASGQQAAPATTGAVDSAPTCTAAATADDSSGCHTGSTPPACSVMAASSSEQLPAQQVVPSSVPEPCTSPGVVQPRPAPAKGRPACVGDVSEWGRTVLEGFYDHHPCGDDTASTCSAATMSSGLSPRGRLAPGGLPFTLESAQQALAYQSADYGRAQALRKGGTAPGAACLLADDLPTRLAYQQLSVLAGMAGKVQDVIRHNQQIFEQRIIKESQAVLRGALDAWLAAWGRQVAKQSLVRRARGCITRGTLGRAFWAWRSVLHLLGRQQALVHQVAAANKRGLLRRTMAAWRQLAVERWWKTQCAARDRQVALLEADLRAQRRRPVVVQANRRLRALLRQWQGVAAAARALRKRVLLVSHRSQARLCSGVWDAWRASARRSAWRAALLRRTAAGKHQATIARAWGCWRALLGEQRCRRMQLQVAGRHERASLQAKALAAWRQWLARKRQRCKLGKRWQQPCQVHVLAAWRTHTTRARRVQLALSRTAAKRHALQLAACWRGWRRVCWEAREDRRLGGSREEVAARMATLAAENERLRRDNERCVRLIDSGEWGRGRVAELVAAGEVLQGERDALLKLIQALRTQFEALQDAQQQQQQQQQLVGQPLRASSHGSSVAVMSQGSQAHTRNRMLIQSGSSFNALVRAMKQELLDSGAAAKDPALLLEIDKLSLDRVHCNPGGELHIEAVASSSAAASRAAAHAKHAAALAGCGSIIAASKPGSLSASGRPLQGPSGCSSLGAGSVGARQQAAPARLAAGAPAVTAQRLSAVLPAPAAAAAVPAGLRASAVLAARPPNASLGTKDPSLSPSARLARWRSQQPGAAASAVPSVVGACGELAAPAQRILAALGELSPQDVAQLEAAVRGQG